MEESLHNTNAHYFKNSICKYVQIRLEKELKRKMKKDSLVVKTKKPNFKVYCYNIGFNLKLLWVFFIDFRIVEKIFYIWIFKQDYRGGRKADRGDYSKNREHQNGYLLIRVYWFNKIGIG
jgi:hypothetical protein